MSSHGTNTETSRRGIPQCAAAGTLSEREAGALLGANHGIAETQQQIVPATTGTPQVSVRSAGAAAGAVFAGTSLVLTSPVRKWRRQSRAKR